MPHLSSIELSAQNAIHNVQLFRSLIHPQTQIVGVIKANAYGHGQNEMAKIIEPYVDFLQVDDLLELRLLRKVSQKRTLVLGYVATYELKEAIALGGELALYDEERLPLMQQYAQELNTTVRVHIKIDALLGRQGVLVDSLEEFLTRVKKHSCIEVIGVYAHFANIEDTADFSHAQKQLDTYQKAVEMCQAAGYTNIKTHISATSGILAYEKNTGRNSLVRLGIGLYGMWPSEELRQEWEMHEFHLKPVMRWVTHIAQVKTVPAEYSIGYGLTFVTPHEMKIAVIPQGYSDGYNRGLSNQGEVLVRGQRCRVLGRVAMNMFVVDVSAVVDVTVEDEVVLLGTQKNECINAEEIARKNDTINYEVTTRVNPLIPRLRLDQ